MAPISILLLRPLLALLTVSSYMYVFGHVGRKRQQGRKKITLQSSLEHRPHSLIQTTAYLEACHYGQSVALRLSCAGPPLQPCCPGLPGNHGNEVNRKGGGARILGRAPSQTYICSTCTCHRGRARRLQNSNSRAHDTFLPTCKEVRLCQNLASTVALISVQPWGAIRVQKYPEEVARATMCSR